MKNFSVFPYRTLPTLGLLNRIYLVFFALVLSLLSYGVYAKPSLNVQVQNDIGEQINLTHYKGKVVYVDFWASWCGPCRKSFPWMQQVYEKYHQQGLAVVAINIDSEKGSANKFLQQLQTKEKLTPSFDIVFDPESNVAKTYDLKGMPSSYIFDRNGKLIYQHVGFFRNQQQKYEQELVDLLEKK